MTFPTAPAASHDWLDPPPGLALATDEVHVWRIPLDVPHAVVRQLATVLTPDERKRAARFLAPIHRTRFQVGRSMLRRILGRYLGSDAARLEFSYGPQGKPSLAGNVRFNLAHSKDLALLGVTLGREIGVDIEALRPLDDAERIVARFFSDREQSEFFRIAPELRQEAFFRAWVRKEAYIKATGKGLSQPLGEFDVTLAPGELPRLLRVEGHPGEPVRWQMVEVLPAVGFQGAMVVESGAGRQRQFVAAPERWLME